MSRIAPASSGGATPLARFAVLLMAVLQVLAPVLPQLGVGQPIGEQSDSVRTLITPAGWAFSIWGPLYAGSFAFAVYQALPTQRENALLARVRWPAAGAYLGNALWAVYTQSFGLSAISAFVILFTLACLLVIYRHISTWQPGFSAGDRWLAVLPLSTLAAWLTAATIVNIAAALRFHGVEAGNAGAAIAASIVVVGGAIASTALIRGRGNPSFALVFLWALAAIYAAGGQVANAVALAAAVAALLVVGATVVGLRRAGAGRWAGRP